MNLWTLEINQLGARIAVRGPLHPTRKIMSQVPADALLLIAPGCPHCASVLASLSELVKNGRIGRLEVVNIAVHPEAAQAAGTRSVPWTRIGSYELAGNYTLGELGEWADKAAAGGNANDYIKELLEQQQLDTAIDYLKQHPDQLPALLELMQEEEQSLTVRFGIGAILEALAGSETLKSLVPALIELAGSEKSNIRADAAHYLGLSGSPEAIPVLKKLLEDENADVREIAGDSLETLEETG